MSSWYLPKNAPLHPFIEISLVIIAVRYPPLAITNTVFSFMQFRKDSHSFLFSRIYN